MLSNLEAAGDKVIDKRRERFDRLYHLTDALKSALSVFFFQHPSLLDFQLKLKEQWKRSNLETMMRVQEIPSNVQIPMMLDGISPEAVSGVFNENLVVLDSWGGLEGFRCLDGGVLLALDGVWYHWSEQIHCEQCLHHTKDGVTTIRVNIEEKTR